MAVKKSELYSSLWASCDSLRGGMDSSQYKDYILTLLFVKYVSDKFKGVAYGAIDVPEGGSFDDMLALIGSKNIGEDMDKIIAAIKKAGISEKDIKTASYYLSPEYDYTYDRAGNMDTKIKGYIVYNRISVTVKNIDKAGDILVVAEEAGANEIGGVVFTVSNPEKFYEQALEKAIADGKKKAGVMAKAAGVTLGKLLEVNEGYNYNSYRYTEYAYSGGAMAMAAGDYGGKVGLESGEIVITAEVTLVYGY
ncbi:MAG: SIMPL domain-containing protein [Leptospirales bacterium]|nr:SIMPL domain-containing protein [Leptospirales bacterium]